MRYKILFANSETNKAVAVTITAKNDRAAVLKFLVTPFPKRYNEKKLIKRDGGTEQLLKACYNSTQEEGRLEHELKDNGVLSYERDFGRYKAVVKAFSMGDSVVGRIYRDGVIVKHGVRSFAGEIHHPKSIAAIRCYLDTINVIESGLSKNI